MSKTIRFYADEQDLQVLCSAVEKQLRLIYVIAGEYEDKRAPIYQTAETIPMFGVSSSYSHLNGTSYLIMEEGTLVKFDSIKRAVGPHAYYIGQKKNPKSIELTPNGAFDGCIIEGQMGTISDDPDSAKLYGLFRKALIEQFTLINGVHVGPGALVGLRKGLRLTQSPRLPSNYDCVTVADLEVS